MLYFCNLKIIHIFHPRYHSKTTGHILKNKQHNKCVCIHEPSDYTINDIGNENQ